MPRIASGRTDSEIQAGPRLAPYLTWAAAGFVTAAGVVAVEAAQVPMGDRFWLTVLAVTVALGPVTWAITTPRRRRSPRAVGARDTGMLGALISAAVVVVGVALTQNVAMGVGLAFSVSVRSLLTFWSLKRSS